MKRKTAEYSWKPVLQTKVFPCDRFKHACCICRGFLYVYGGRHTTTLSDFWRYRIGSNEWERLDSSENGPEELEDHTMVEYQGILYIFGGMVDSAFTQKKNPFWLYDTDTKQWCPVPATLYGCSPGPRHGHAAVVYSSGMYLFGGLMGLSEQNDFWKWDFIAANWCSIRRSQGPPKVVGHSALIFQDSMIVFGGGISNMKPNGTLWKYHFPSEMWEKKVGPKDGNPSCKAYHCLLGLGYGFQEMADASCVSLNCCSHRKEKRCSKLRAISKQHSCLCEYFQPGPAYRAFNNDDGNEIEMSVLHQPSKQPGFCSLQTISNAELSANQPAGLLSKKEKISYLDLSTEQDQVTPAAPEKEAGFNCLNSDRVDIGELSAVLFVVGGKPFSSSSAISFWQMELDTI
ncbi:leucine-zipper-like transcriptional regulator 1 homolog isoform X3 [Heteronotia binoei]|uniref:leucine-zipper-like transcriptional regulator 1 homolog isoform X3 n=1 Tax=Heteronotia binoei TaxID=13085 RepID=UPI002930FAC5|nr:leucine-zipper-like transcriptional regulator 1 homolog isoform X3 [Heteronotia binoei]